MAKTVHLATGAHHNIVCNTPVGSRQEWTEDARVHTCLKCENRREPLCVYCGHRFVGDRKKLSECSKCGAWWAGGWHKK